MLTDLEIHHRLVFETSGNLIGARAFVLFKPIDCIIYFNFQIFWVFSTGFFGSIDVSDVLKKLSDIADVFPSKSEMSLPSKLTMVRGV